MKAGDRVKLIGIPPDAKDAEHLQTRGLFEKCLGKWFVVTEVETVDGLAQLVATIEVGQVLGAPPSQHKIWVEERYLQTGWSN
jgi:hypothetical protein